MSSKTIEWPMKPLRLKTLEIAPSLIAICAEPPIVRVELADVALMGCATRPNQNRYFDRGLLAMP